MTIYETAVKVNNLYKDYDPYNFEEEMCPPEEIATVIEKKDFCLPQELMEILTECNDDETMKSRVLDVFTEVMKHYA